MLKVGLALRPLNSKNCFTFPGDEMFSDTYKVKLIDEVMYEVYGRVSKYKLALFVK